MNMSISNRSPFEIRAFMSHQGVMAAPGMNLSKGMKGSLVGMLNKHLGGDANRKLVLGWLFKDGSLTAMSSHELKEEQWNALSDWVGLWHDEDANEWRPRSTFTFEAAQVLTEVIREVSQLSNADRAKLPRISESLHTAVGLGGTITHADDNTSVLETPKFDELVQRTVFGNLILSGDKDRDSF